MVFCIGTGLINGPRGTQKKILSLVITLAVFLVTAVQRQTCTFLLLKLCMHYQKFLIAQKMNAN